MAGSRPWSHPYWQKLCIMNLSVPSGKEFSFHSGIEEVIKIHKIYVCLEWGKMRFRYFKWGTMSSWLAAFRKSTSRPWIQQLPIFGLLCLSVSVLLTPSQHWCHWEDRILFNDLGYRSEGEVLKSNRGGLQYIGMRKVIGIIIQSVVMGSEWNKVS